MKTFSNPLTQKICDILRPLMGDSMSVGIIMSQSKRLGINEESINQSHLGVLSEGITKGLIIFLGSDVASQVGGRIKMLR
jgi:hypothetical protein